MARVAQTDAENANKASSGAQTTALNNFNTQSTALNNDISAQEGQGDPYTSKSYLTNQNLLTSGAMNSQDTAAKQQLQDAALRTGTNTASLGRTVSSNARAGQRTMDDYNAGVSNQNVDKNLALQQSLIGDRAQAANVAGGLYGTATGGVNAANQDLTTLQGQNEAMWGNIIGGVAGGVGSAVGKGGILNK